MEHTKFLVDISKTDNKVSANVEVDGHTSDIATAICHVFDKEPKLYELLKHSIKVYEIGQSVMQNANLKNETNE